MRAEHLFVYGTLREGRDDALAQRLNREAALLGTGALQGRLYRIDWYPGFIDSREDGECVYGDLYRLSEKAELLKALDDYEGCGENDPEPHEYRREKRMVRLGDKEVEAWVYVYNWSLDGKDMIPGGNFLAERKAGLEGAEE